MNLVRNVLVFVVLACLGLSAQQITGSIRGTVTDPLGAIVEGAKVTVRQSETGLSRTVITDRSGNYVVLELPVGHYRLQVTAKGFQEYVQDGISLNVNETASVSPHLLVGSEIEVVQVNADADLIEPGVTSICSFEVNAGGPPAGYEDCVKRIGINKHNPTVVAD
jgi:hypothetical protein